MNIMGIVLLIVGALVFAASFIISNKGQDDKKYTKAMGMKLDLMINERVDEVKDRLSNVADATREEEEIRAKRELERITNEKIMAIDDYSRAVLEEIEKNHKEVMFLYDMLDNKTSDVKNTIRKADAFKEQQESALREQENAAKHQENAVKEQQEIPYDGSDAGFSILQEPEFRKDKEKELSGMDRLKNAINSLGGGRPQDEAPAAGEADLTEAKPLSEPELKKDEMSRNDRVLEMKKSGMDNVDIAKTLNIGVGEVNLITDLFSETDGKAGEGA